jgi:hypothetical protein
MKLDFDRKVQIGKSLSANFIHEFETNFHPKKRQTNSDNSWHERPRNQIFINVSVTILNLIRSYRTL